MLCMLQFKVQARVSAVGLIVATLFSVCLTRNCAVLRYVFLKKLP